MRDPMVQKRPFWLGVLLAPWAAPIGLLVFWWGVEVLFDGRQLRPLAMMEEAAYVFVIGLPLAYAGMLVLGLPLALFLRRRGRLSILALGLGAVLLGALEATLVVQWFGTKVTSPVLDVLGAGCAFMVALAFGLICGMPWWRPRVAENPPA